MPLLEESGLRAGHDFALAFSPERVDPGRTDFTLRTTPKVVGGLTPACQERAVALYERVCETVVPVSSPEAAELPAAADGADLALIVTAHPSVDHRAIAERAQVTLDLRGVTRGLGAASLPLFEAAGLDEHGREPAVALKPEGNSATAGRGWNATRAVECEAAAQPLAQ